MLDPTVQWTSPTPLWPAYANAPTADERAKMRGPHILRFATDTFMDEFMALLQNEPQRLAEWIAYPETWYGPADQPRPIQKLPPLVQRLERLRLATATPLAGNTTALAPAPTATDAKGVFKLYQPGHMRFYLVTACLVCRLPGLPDRVLNLANGERVSYVVRRLRPKAGATQMPAAFDLDTCDEYAFVDGKRWALAQADALLPGEEQNPMFGVTYVEGDGRKRRMLAAPIPVGKRETYLAAAATPVVPDPHAAPPVDPRKAVLLRTVTDPWRSIADQYNNALAQFNAPGPPGVPGSNGTEKSKAEGKVKENADNSAIWLSWLTLLDFADFLAQYVKDVWAVVTHKADASSLGNGTNAAALYQTLVSATYNDAGTVHSLAWALNRITSFRDQLEYGTTPYPPKAPATASDFPDFHFPLHDPTLAALVAPPQGSTAKTLDDQVVDALPHDPPPHTPPLPLAAAMATLDAREPAWFIIRCVFEQPNCTPIVVPLLSAATRPFQMASFFDPDAPARPIRIALPLDTSPAGLRKFDRNTAFMVSDMLCGQIKRMQSMTFGDLVLSVLPWPFHKDLPSADVGPCAEEGSGVSFGMICSLSIPIITICALILLIIIVNLLDIIFHWIPFFILCFPVPRFRGKDKGA